MPVCMETTDVMLDARYWRNAGKMIIVNPNHRNPSPQSTKEPPIWCAYLADYYEGHLNTHHLEILDAEAEGLSVEETKQRIGDQQAVLVTMGANPSASSTPKMSVTEELLDWRPMTMVFGLHPSATRARTNLGIPCTGRLCDMTPRWDLIDFPKYKAHNWHCLDGRDRSGYGVVYTSFGCPFNCSYCNIHTLYKTRGVAYRKPEDVVDEIADLVETHSVRNLKVCDELFVLNHTHVEKICDLLIERNYDLNIWAYAKVGLVNPRLLEKLKEAGFNWLAYGFESGDDDILRGVGKEQSMEQAFKTVEMTRQAGINTIGNFIFGLPNDDMKSMYNTFRFALYLQCEWVNFYCATAYPGSQLYEDTPKKDLPDRWEDYDQYSPSFKPLPTTHLTSQEVLEFRDKSFRSYFSKTNYLNMIGGKFGEQAVNRIQEMLQWSPRGNDARKNN